VSNTDWNLRRWHASDSLEELTELVHAAYAPHLAAGHRFVGTHQTVAMTAERLATGDAFIATCAGRIVGTVLARPPKPDSSAPLYRDPRTWSISQLAVSPLYKGRGLGKALHDVAVGHAIVRGARTIALDTAAPAAGLIAMYESWGYRVVGNVDWRPHTNYESVLMAQPVSSFAAGLEGAEHDKWKAFYADRSRPRPFFTLAPDESLSEWVLMGRIAAGRALDVGCGNGRNAIFLARQGFIVDAVDYSDSAVAWAREEVARAAVPVDVRHQSIFDVQLEPESYDLVYDSGCFHHLPPHRREAYVELVAGALRHGGAFGLACFTADGGSGLSDEAVYEQRSLGGGLGYDEQQLRVIWSPHLQVKLLRPMSARSPDSGLFGTGLLWALLAVKP